MPSKITFVIPAYNASPYIGEALGSLQAQTVADWEAVVVDDASSDDTFALPSRFAEADPRIRVFQSEERSGSAFMPRMRAVSLAATEWVAPLDADDWLEPSYLEKMLGMLGKEKADVVFPTIYIVDNDGSRLLSEIPEELRESSIPGKDCVAYTLNGWRIHTGGGIISRRLFLDVAEETSREGVYSCLDEFFIRVLIFKARRAAFSGAQYFYRMNGDSVTHRHDITSFDYLRNDRRLLSFTRRFYGEGSEEFSRANMQVFFGYMNAVLMLSSPGYRHIGSNAVKASAKASLAASCRKKIRKEAGNKWYLLSFLPLCILKILFRLRESLRK